MVDRQECISAGQKTKILAVVSPWVAVYDAVGCPLRQPLRAALCPQGFPFDEHLRFREKCKDPIDLRLPKRFKERFRNTSLIEERTSSAKDFVIFLSLS